MTTVLPSGWRRVGNESFWLFRTLTPRPTLKGASVRQPDLDLDSRSRRSGSDPSPSFAGPDAVSES